jgi:hypothetical protein
MEAAGRLLEVLTVVEKYEGDGRGNGPEVS